jgi:archaemetzincin
MKYLSIIFITLLLFGCSESKKPAKETIVGLLPYEGISKEKTLFIKNAIDEYYGVKTYILDAETLPKSVFTNIKSPRYRADSLIAIQKRTKADTIDYVMGLTEKDISAPRYENGKIKKPVWKYNDFGIMGLAYRPGNSAVVSDFRLKHQDKARQFTRFKKVALHEFGHNLGLPHCADKKCVMTSAMESIKTIDNEEATLCAKCRAKIK